MIALQEASVGEWGYDQNHQLRALTVGKFTVTEVLTPTDHFVLKTTDDPAAQADLGNSVAWAEWVHAQRPTTFRVPRVTATLAKNDRGQFVTSKASTAWVGGSQPTEATLHEIIPPYADIVQELGSMKVSWTGDAAGWLRSKLQGVGSIALGNIADRLLAIGITDIVESDNVEATQAGVVHGDLVPKNTLIDSEGEPWLIDAEFGTHGRRPGFAVPRMRDAAYLYHVLSCQYHQPELAQDFLAQLTQRFANDPTWEREFWTATLERTLSMYKLFVMDHPSGPTIDPRRYQPEPYMQVLYDTVDHIRA